MNYIKQLKQARLQTIQFLQAVSSLEALSIPKGASNNLLWHAGHLYVTLEKFAFSSVSLPSYVPNTFGQLFSKGTSPEDWHHQTLPTLEEIILLLNNQLNRLNDIPLTTLHPIEALTTGTGFHLPSQEAYLTYALYHEAMHFGQMKLLLKLLR